VDSTELEAVRRTLVEADGDLVVMFGGELSAAAQAVIAQLPQRFVRDGRRVLLHPLPLHNNSIGALDMGFAEGALTLAEMLEAAGGPIRALYIVGSLRVAAMSRR